MLSPAVTAAAAAAVTAAAAASTDVSVQWIH